MRSLLLLPIVLAILPAAAPVAQAQPVPAPLHTAAARTHGQYGGGFIELLMTGRDPTPVRAPLRGMPPPEQMDEVDAMPPRAALRRPLRQPAAGFAIDPDEDDAGPRAQRPVRQAALDPRVQMGLPGRYEKQVVEYDGRHAPGTVVIDTPNRFLYLVQPGGKALRYGIGVGRPGFEWGGVKTITRKAEWPDWRPPVQMLKRRPDLPRYMAGGPDNPMGARGLYLGSSLYRIHGTNEPHTIGQAVSSGCIRMRNQDVMDLYERVRVGTRVIVI
jgi:lipoprotein-anchoring transpeptidase ErfK/SrfK